MRIAAIAKGMGVGGIETFLINLSSGLRSRGHSFDIICTLYRGEWFEKYASAFDAVLDQTILRNQSRQSQAKQLGRFLTDQGYDAVLVNLSQAGQAAVDFLPPDVLAVTIVHEYLRDEHHKRIELCRLDAFDAIVGVSEGVCESIRRQTPDPPNLTCIPHGIRVPTKPPRARDSNEVIYVGRMTDEKGVQFIPEIVHRVLDGGTEIRMTMVGDGPALESAKREVAAKSLGDHFEFTGSLTVAEAHDRVEQASVFLFPSVWEGFGLVLVEAMALGAVPVATRLHGVTDNIVSHGETGFLFDAADVQSAADSIIRLMREPELRHQMVARGYEVLQERFTLDRMVDDYERLLTELQTDKRPVQRLKRLGYEPLRKIDALPVWAVDAYDRLRGRR